jgi:hypothetical protein
VRSRLNRLLEYDLCCLLWLYIWLHGQEKLRKKLTISNCRILVLDRVGQVCTEMTMSSVHTLFGYVGDILVDAGKT